MLVLSRADVRRLLDLDLLIEALVDAFVALSDGAASVPPRVAAMTPEGALLAAMPGYVRGVLESKLVAVFPENDTLGLPTHQALIALFDPHNGAPIAVMDGTEITAARTAAASALATRTLANEDAHVLAVLGSGVQARSHLDAVRRVRHFTEVRVAAARARTLRRLRTTSTRHSATHSRRPFAAPTSSARAPTLPRPCSGATG